MNTNNKSHIKTAVISLDILKKEDYEKFKKLSFLQRKSYDEIWQHYPMVGKGYDEPSMTREVAVIEPYLLLHHLKQNGITCKLWYGVSMFIYNNDLYRIIGGKVEKIDLDGLYYFSLRETFSHPFFSILEILLAKNSGKLAKPNIATMKNSGCMNKMYGIKELYMHREKYMQDIIIPYNLKKADYELFFEFIRTHIGNRVIFKNDCIQEGRGVIFKDISNRVPKELYDSLEMHTLNQKELIITPLYDIQAEYRCYFTNYDTPKIFSIKQRVNITDENELLEKENIRINVNLHVQWKLISSDSKVFEEAAKTALGMIKLMSYDTGCIEFALTKEGKIVFFEVNQMAGPLPFEGEDCKNINEYYISMFDEMTK